MNERTYNTIQYNTIHNNTMQYDACARTDMKYSLLMKQPRIIAIQ